MGCSNDKSLLEKKEKDRGNLNSNVNIKSSEDTSENSISEIKCTLFIDKDDFKEDIIIFNNYGNNNDDFINNINAYLDENKIDIKKEGNKCKINYNFKKKGEYVIKIIFNKILTNIKGFFNECSIIKYIDLSNFNTSKVTDMSLMFNKCNNLKKIKGIENFNTSQVINMTGMFKECRELEDLNLSNFNTSNVTNMEVMFIGCSKLKKIKGIEKF